MTTATPAPTLEEVRRRFLEAEQRLQEIGASLTQLRSAAGALQSAEHGLRGAGEGLAALCGTVGQSAGALHESVATMREGVEAIRQSDVARVETRVGTMLLDLQRISNDVRTVAAAVDAGIQVTREGHTRGEASFGDLRTTLDRKIDELTTRLGGVADPDGTTTDQLGALRRADDVLVAGVSEANGLLARMWTIQDAAAERLEQVHSAVGAHREATVKEAIETNAQVVAFRGAIEGNLASMAARLEALHEEAAARNRRLIVHVWLAALVLAGAIAGTWWSLHALG